MKKLVFLLLFVSLAACQRETQHEHLARQQDVKNKLKAQEKWMHACDNNGGVADIAYSRYDSTLVCANHLEASLSTFLNNQ